MDSQEFNAFLNTLATRKTILTVKVSSGSIAVRNNKRNTKLAASIINCGPNTSFSEVYKWRKALAKRENAKYRQHFREFQEMLNANSTVEEDDEIPPLVVDDKSNNSSTDAYKSCEDKEAVSNEEEYEETDAFTDVELMTGLESKAIPGRELLEKFKQLEANLGSHDARKKLSGLLHEYMSTHGQNTSTSNTSLDGN